MVRSCHVDTCPVGIATQRPELRAKFAGDAGAWSRPTCCSSPRRCAAARRARTPLLRRGRRARSTCCAAGSAATTGRAARPRRRCSRRRRRRGALRRRADRRRRRRARRAARRRARRARRPASSSRVRDRERRPRGRRAARRGDSAAVGASRRRAGPRPLHGLGRPELRRLPAPPASSSMLDGEANDYVGKSLSGGRIVVRPPGRRRRRPVPRSATRCSTARPAGELFCAGAAGERFAVRNSGATAVVEGAGEHACEYMTERHRRHPRRVRPQPRRGHDRRRGVRATTPTRGSTVRLNAAARRGRCRSTTWRGAVAACSSATSSSPARRAPRAVLADWDEASTAFRVVRPRAEIARIEAEAEGTASGDPDTDPAGEAVAV